MFRASAFQAECRELESRLRLQYGNILKWFKRALCKSVICRWFKSNCYLQYMVAVAQLVERQIVALSVARSIRVGYPVSMILPLRGETI